jgi:hypothetical protein
MTTMRTRRRREQPADGVLPHARAQVLKFTQEGKFLLQSTRPRRSMWIPRRTTSTRGRRYYEGKRVRRFLYKGLR